MRRNQAGQATVEWSALVLISALSLAALGYFVVRADGRRLGGEIIRSVVCAVGDGCPGALEEAYGKDLAHVVRHYAPNVAYERDSAELPVDFRRCRALACSNGPDDPVQIDHSAFGLPVTAFTHVADLRRRTGELYVQYWFYYPESFTGGLG